LSTNNESNEYLSRLESLPSLTGRLGIIELSTDSFINFHFYIYFSEMEKFIFGVLSQYARIMENVPKPSSRRSISHSLTQLRLDVYYYTLNWDKIRKVFEKFNKEIDNILKPPNTIPSGFVAEYKKIKIRMNHLFKDHKIGTRNEYEHPSLEPSQVGTLIGFGNSTIDNKGNIKVHVGREEFAIVKKDYIDRLYSLWIEFIDLFINNFSDKPSTADLLSIKNNIEEQIDDQINLYYQLRNNEESEEAQNLLNVLIITDVRLFSEGCPLHENVRKKIHSILFQGD